MSENERIEAAEQALFQSWNHFRALRSVGFLLSETEGGGPSDWTGQPIEDLAALVDVLARHGAELANAGLEELQGLRIGAIKSA